MYRNRIRNVVVHAPDSMQALTPKIDAFYVEAIERRLNQSNFTTAEKIAVIDRIITQLKLRSFNGIIK